MLFDKTIKNPALIGKFFRNFFLDWKNATKASLSIHVLICLLLFVCWYMRFILINRHVAFGRERKYRVESGCKIKNKLRVTLSFCMENSNHTTMVPIRFEKRQCLSCKRRDKWYVRDKGLSRSIWVCAPFIMGNNILQMVVWESIFFNRPVSWSQMTRLWAILITYWISVYYDFCGFR